MASSLQLSAVGDENNYLNAKPKITFFKKVYMRHTNFSMRTDKLKSGYNEQLSYNSSTHVKIPILRNGDLINNIFLKFKLPEIYSDIGENKGFKYIKNVGTMIIKRARFIIDNQLIEEIDGEFLFIYHHLFNSPEKNILNDRMTGNKKSIYNPVGNVDKEYRGYTDIEFYTKNNKKYINKNFDNKPTISSEHLYIPLSFWFSRNNGLAFPILSLSYHQVFVELELRPIREIILLMKKEIIEINKPQYLDPANNNSDNDVMERFYYQSPSDNVTFSSFLNNLNWNLDLSLEVNYIFLDNEERNILVKNNQKYLIEQVILRKADNISGKKIVQMKLFHPIKELFIAPRRNDVNLRNDWSNFTNLDYLEQDYKSYQTYFLELSEKESQLNNENLIKYLGQFRKLNDNTVKLYTSDNQIKWNSISNDKLIESDYLYTPDDFEKLLDIWNYRESKKIPSINLINHKFYSSNILNNMSISLNNHVMLQEKERKYFEHLQYFQHHKSENLDHIPIYSFSFNPQIFQPTGSCNFSKINLINFNLDIKEPKLYIKSEPYNYDFNFYFINYNLLDFRNGLAGLVFAN